MPIAAVPNYLGSRFGTASPGLHFSMLLSVWTEQWEKSKEASKAIRTEIASEHVECMKALIERQNGIRDVLHGFNMLSLEAESVAPFTTGLGNERPLENGFAFLNPYGLPYLPGSGIKGVLRRSVQELISENWGDSCGWSDEKKYRVDGEGETLSMVDVLFGFEPPSGKQYQFRGVLSFWDVIPLIKKKPLKQKYQLAVEIMNPHHTAYYQNEGKPPDEFGDPIPIFFLTVPPGSGFTFHISCHMSRLRQSAPDLAENDCWKELLEQAFRHAFDWMGFGAKTAVGYGAMRLTPAAQRQEQQRKDEQDRIEAQKRENQRKAEEEAEEQRQQMEAEARKQAEFEALPESRRILMTAQESFEKFRQGSQLNKKLGENANRQAKQLTEQAPEWINDAEREEAASLLEKYYERAGWHIPGANKKQRDRQRKKKVDAIARIRRGPGKCTS